MNPHDLAPSAPSAPPAEPDARADELPARLHRLRAQLQAQVSDREVTTAEVVRVSLAVTLAEMDTNLAAIRAGLAQLRE